jgi:predicted AAA+ superfamily ATPase
LIDEIQYAPELFPYIKMLVDSSNERGRIWLTGSQAFHLMQNVSESLAGRVAIIDMQGLSIYERQGKGLSQHPFLPLHEPAQILENKGIEETFSLIWQGSFPDIIDKDAKTWLDFYDSYTRTYLERDVRQIINVSNEALFLIFLKAVAARTAQELNISDLAKDVGIANGTAKQWLSVLETAGLVYLLRPYYRNITKRLIKRPKLYFLDTGLAAYLAGWTTAQALEAGVSGGAFFETFVVSEILKSWHHNDNRGDFYYFRDEKQHEIDLLIHQDGRFFPIEIKKHASPQLKDVRNFRIFGELEPIGPGCEICLCKDIEPLDKDIIAMPVWAL